MRKLQKTILIIMLSAILSPASLVVNAQTLTNEADLVSKINTARTDAGLETLAVDAELTKAAQIRAKEAAESFSHTRPDGSAFYTVSDKTNGENLAKGESYNTTEEYMTMWMNSKTHRDNILYQTSTKTGIGIYEAPDGSIFIAEEFN